MAHRCAHLSEATSEWGIAHEKAAADEKVNLERSHSWESDCDGTPINLG